MAYIIENAHILRRGELKDLSLLVENNKISSLRTSFKLYKHFRMNADDYIMTPTHVMFDFTLPLTEPFATRKSYYLNEFIYKGCTTILTCAPVTKEKELTSQLKKIQTALSDCPIDYVIGVRIPLTLLTPRFIRSCKRYKIPAVFVELHESEDLKTVPWGWVKEAMFPYNSPLIPMFLNDDQKLRNDWTGIMSEHKIPSILEEIKVGVPIPIKILEKIGVFPKKSNLHQGGEVSYNFYLKDSETVKMIESELFSRYDSSLMITIHKGKVIRAMNCLNYLPGYGEHVLIHKPAFYLSPT